MLYITEKLMEFAINPHQHVCKLWNKILQEKASNFKLVYVLKAMLINKIIQKSQKYIA